ncbi:hypothetical protein F2Q70_00009666 [Brassica cretica]|uniref:NB-ARC domain-containing protein n=1 Tax=Brassica cretica TaxID=69181 RepID=A0A8S9M5I9_BRACR|nr:hypothetical protein F2Q70_00009666 [Brassica cretica]
MLRHRKALIFIDGLDDQDVLDALAGRTQWAHGIDHIYEVCLPSKDVALEIFCRSAFRRNSPPDGFMELASEVVFCAGNLPLGLDVLGSNLRGRDKDDWLDMLPRLRTCLDRKIERTLRASYDGLNNKKDKAIFRHVACLFSGRKVDHIKLLLEDRNLDINIGLKNLVDKSLIHERFNTVEMHSLLQEMGKEIVRAQSDEPGEREFLMDSKDIWDGTKRVLGIELIMDETDELHSLTCLKEIDLTLSVNLKEIPDLSKAMNLERLCLDFCSSLLELPSSIRNLKKLRDLEMNFCTNLETIPTGIYLNSFEGFVLSGCSRLRRFPEILTNISESLSYLTLDVLNMTNLRSENLWEGVQQPFTTLVTRLQLSEIPSLVELPSSFQNLNKLKWLDIRNCINLETLPTGINLQSLEYLVLSGCSRLRSFPNISRNIQYLKLSFSAIEEVPWWVEKFSALKDLNMANCTNLRRISLNILKLKHLKVALFSNCGALTEANWDDSPSIVAIATDTSHSSLPDRHVSIAHLNFTGCFNLDHKDLFQQQTVFMRVILSGEEVPSYFTHHISGNHFDYVDVQPEFSTSRLGGCGILFPENGQSMGNPNILPHDFGGNTSNNGYLGGHETVHSQEGNEAAMIEEIANDVLDKLLLTSSKDSENFVGIEDHLAKLSVLLQLDAEEVRMVGLWGFSGIGKTTIARVLFQRLSRHFRGSIFIDRAFVSKTMEIFKAANPDDYNMKLHLQRNFLSEILGKGDIKINHLSAVGERLKNQKVLIFIDDFDDQVVLDTLVGQTQCGLSVTVGLENLADKSLIHVRENYVEMHRLLEEMGRRIVRLDEPEKREFLVDAQDICDVLSQDTGTHKILGIKLNIDEIDELNVHENAFKGMRNLRFLEIHSQTRYEIGKEEVTIHLPENFDYLPPKLKILDWYEYPMRCLPSKFRPEKLVKLKMVNSKLEKLWEGIVKCQMATNLETLYLRDCYSLVKLPSSIPHPNKLTTLYLSNCRNVETIPTGISLKNLYTVGCSRMRTFPQISSTIKDVDIDATSIEEIPSNMSLCYENLNSFTMHSLKKLSERVQGRRVAEYDFVYLVQLLTLLTPIMSPSLRLFPPESTFQSLDLLDLSGCSRLKTFPDISTHIKYLDLSETGIEEVPCWIEKFSRLNSLQMKGCNNLEYVNKCLHISLTVLLEPPPLSPFLYFTALSRNRSSDSELALCLIRTMSHIAIVPLDSKAVFGTALIPIIRHKTSAQSRMII